MTKAMPVVIPHRINLTVNDFLKGDLFGFVRATVMAPANEYIGLLPIKYLGKLICPGGTFPSKWLPMPHRGFSGLFFSEELRFALDNGYELISISQAW